MPQSKKNSLKLNMPPAFRRKAGGLVLLMIGVIPGILIVVAQQGEPMTQKQIPVFDRIENVIKVKEPKFKLAGKLLRNNEEMKHALLGWQSGEEIVSSTTYELASPQEAEEMLRKSINAPMSVPVQITRLTQLGDEAYMSTGFYAKEGKTNLLLRRGKYFIIMTASSQDLAKRFAKHIVTGIDN